MAEAGDGAGLPQFVEREFREFLLCGVFEAGVARVQCEGCAREHLVPHQFQRLMLHLARLAPIDQAPGQALGGPGVRLRAGSDR